MKRLTLLIFLALVLTALQAEINYSTEAGKVKLHFMNEGEEGKEELTQILAVPARQIEIAVQNCVVSHYDERGELLQTENVRGSDYFSYKNSFVMRELFGHNFNLQLIREKNNEKFVLEEMEMEIIPQDIVSTPTKVSVAFLPIYRQIVDNYSTSYLNGLDSSHSKMLIITHDDLVPTIQVFAEWKNACGIATDIVTKADIGITNSEIKSYIQDLYDTEEYPPDYILLTGDIDDSFEIPAYFYNFSGELDVTDHPYTLLDGDDYFPEMIIGRISVDNVFQLQTIVAKILNYEKTPFMDQTHWFQNATLVAGNYSPTPPNPTTPVKVTKWFRDKLYENDYNEIDQIYYPPTYPGTSQITSSINQGVGIVSYRGWGDANGWHYPLYHNDDLEDLNNGSMLPVIASFVCNTGDFANVVDPCFGEKWLQMGTPASPKGGVIFVGPSDLHTSTKLNNSIFSGFVTGIYDEDIYNFGSAILRGKIELYNNFPLNQAPSDLVDSYFNVYNILGDPSLKIWTKVPEPINCDLPSEVNIGTNFLNLDLPDLNGAVVTAIKENEFMSTEIVENGIADIYLDSETSGDIQITITKENYHPFQQNIAVVSDNVDIGLENVETDQAINAGIDIALEISLKNFGSQTANGISANLISESSFVNIINSQADFGDINAGEISSNSYDISIDENCPNNEILEFDLAVSEGTTLKFELIANSLVFEVSEISIANDFLEPGMTDDITIQIQNLGTFNVSEVIGTLSSADTEIMIPDPDLNFGNIAMNSFAETTTAVTVSEDVYIGKNIPFQIEIFDANDLQTIIHFNLEIGEVDQSAPTGPDQFGYYAYDSHDVFYTKAPTYDWIEIDPAEGGNGDVFELGDDRSESIEMPMNFVYYDQPIDSLTICTNGWISLQPTWETYFRNWNIPSALGPYGMIAPYWDDLIGELEDGEHKDMRICYYYDTAENIFIVEWNKCVNREDDTSVEKFQIILFDPDHYPTNTGNGEIQFNYHTVNNPDVNGNYCTVGIENFQQSDGLLYTYANIYPNSATPLYNELAIKFTTEEPEYSDVVNINPNFTAQNTSGYKPLEVSFENQTTPQENNFSYQWDFGDNSPISTESDPTHIYDQVGSYEVTLSVSNGDTTATISKSDFINVYSRIFPGDADNNGIVDADDIFPIGIYWRETGDSRSIIGFDWNSYDYPSNWNDIYAPYADCDGNGEVDILDVLAICYNWGKTQPDSSLSFAHQFVEQIEEKEENFISIYHSLENSGTQLLLKNAIAERFDLPIVSPEIQDQLFNNFPNPFNPTTKIRFSFAEEPQNASLTIYNVKGQKIKKYQINADQNGEIIWHGNDEEGKDVSSGIYFYRLQNKGKTIDIKKMILLK